MNEPITFTMADVIALIRAIAALIGAIGVITGAIIWLWNKLKQPNVDQNSRLDSLEEWRKNVEERLDDGAYHFEKIDQSNKITQRAILALLAHGIDGNSIDPMVKAKDELQAYLIEK